MKIFQATYSVFIEHVPDAITTNQILFELNALLKESNTGKIEITESTDEANKLKSGHRKVTITFELQKGSI